MWTRNLSLATLLLAAPAMPGVARADPARIEDIAVSRQGADFRMLVKVSGQPNGAAATANGGALALAIDGVSLPVLSFAPRPASGFTQVTVVPAGRDGATLRFDGLSLSNVSATIYRGAVLVEGRVVGEPAAPAAPARPFAAPPARTVTPPPAAGKPMDIVPVAAARSGAAPATAKKADAAALAGLSRQDCETAAAGVRADSWNLAALGDHALCLISAGNLLDARERLDQLAAFDPGDWRVSLGRAVLLERSGNTKGAAGAFRAAAKAAPDATVRAAISAHVAG